MVTAVFPFGSVTENAFVAPEIEPLSKRFDKIYLIPMEIPANHEVEVKLPDNVEVVEDFAAMMARSRARLRYFAHPWVHGAIFDAAIHAHNPWSAATYAAAALSWKKEFERFMAQREIDPASTLFYTFWLDAPSTALAFLADDSKHFNTISRIHGYELRDARSPMLKKFTVASLRALYPVSLESESRLRQLYSPHKEKIIMRHLGSQKAEAAELAPVPDSNIPQLRFVSVARVVPVKRVSLILKLMLRLASLQPNRHIVWAHIGDGDSMVEMSKVLSKGLPPNLTVELNGELDNADVHEYLRSQTIHWNVLLSSAEGGVPVALCEGASYGIPAIATAVGGIPELVDASTGILVDEPIDIDQLAREIIDASDDIELYQHRREAIFQRWQTNFSADALRSQFAENVSLGQWRW